VSSTLSRQQLGTYGDDGFLLVSDLIKPKVVQAAHDALIQQIQGSRPLSHHAFIRDHAVLACFTREVCSAAAVLAGARTPLPPPRVTYTISVFPTSGPWEWPKPHIDHALKKDAYRTFPPPFRAGCLIYLNDVPAHCGATVVWPGSHRKLESLAAARPEEYKYMWALNRDIPMAELPSPVELTPRAGDALFYQYLCAHAGSLNTGHEPRLALSHKW
jgi:ectoine hydroxylase-related dioxygenase (phytanoyl-CoA dioxygenase family)